MKILGRIGSLSLKAVESAINGVISGAYKAVGKKGIILLIENDVRTLDLILRAVMMSASQLQSQLKESLSNLPDVQKEKLARVIVAVQKTVIPALAVARNVAQRLPDSVLDGIDGEWILRRLKKWHPEIAKVIKEHPKGMEWLEKEAELIRAYLLQKVRWDTEKGCLVILS
ncbi:MAG: hypothetical protein ACTSR0_04220 [Candidatus Asgardarchaeia archaeon]